MLNSTAKDYAILIQRKLGAHEIRAEILYGF